MIIATIIEIENIDTLNIVKFNFHGNTLKMMSLELSDTIKVGKEVKLSIKPTHVAISKNFSGVVSFANQIKAKILSLENGKLLSSIFLSVENTILESIILADSSLKMDLKVDDEVTILIQASEISVSKTLS